MVKLLKIYAELSKLRLGSLVLFTAFLPLLISPEGLSAFTDYKNFLFCIGTWLIVCAANTCNQIIERHSDGLMERTKNRPLVIKSISLPHAFIFSCVILLLGLGLLAFASNFLTTCLGTTAFALYTFVYTPMKKLSSAALFVGAIPGAIPPLMGWTHATGEIGVIGFILFWILFFWQIPHFISIALFLKDDYKKAGIITMPETIGEFKTQQQLFIYGFAMVLVSLLPLLFGKAGTIYASASLVFGVIFLSLCIAALKKIENLSAVRRVFYASLIYLPVVLGFWLMDTLIGGKI